MSDILVFQHPQQVERAKGQSVISKMRFPSRSRQRMRLDVKFNTLAEEMERQHAMIQEDTMGIDPEYVLVFEVVGFIGDFQKAAQKAGLEWAGEIEEEGYTPDEDFFQLEKSGERSDKPITQKAFLTITSQRSLQKVMSLWRDYKNSNAMERGLTAFRDVFSRLKDIHKWGYKERLEDQGFKNLWDLDSHAGNTTSVFEIELWYRNNEESRNKAKQQIKTIIESYGGSIVNEICYPQICYHALIVRCTIDVLRSIIEERNELIHTESIMCFHATGQAMDARPSVIEDETDITNSNNQQVVNTVQPGGLLPTVDSPIALLDGVPLQNHDFLSGRINVDDIFSLEDNAIANSRIHGTAMASLIIHGDLNSQQPMLDERLYILPVMSYNPQYDQETIPQGTDLVDLLHCAIKHIVDEPNLNNRIRIISLSINDQNLPFFSAISPAARMIDYLSEKYNLLFVICAGNYSDFINISSTTYANFSQLNPAEKQSAVYDERLLKQRNMRILSPSEAINGLCVGATQEDAATLSTPEYRIFPVMDGYPTTYSRFGGGFLGALKPDCVVSGGREMFQNLESDNAPLNLRPSFYPGRGPSHSVASPVSVNSRQYMNGTSDSAALSSRMCADVLAIIRQINGLELPIEFESIAAKTMFIHSCSWGDIGKHMKDVDFVNHSRQQRAITERWIGYGKPDISSVVSSSQQRCVVVGYGNIQQGEALLYRLPLPPCLASRTDDKRLTITLGWASPINPNSHNYKLANLSFEEETTLLNLDRVDADGKKSRKGTVQHEVFEGHKAAAFVDGDCLRIRVECKPEKKLVEYPVKFFLAATLEVKGNVALPLYQEIRERLAIQARVR